MCSLSSESGDGVHMALRRVGLGSLCPSSSSYPSLPAPSDLGPATYLASSGTIPLTCFPDWPSFFHFSNSLSSVLPWAFAHAVPFAYRAYLCRVYLSFRGSVLGVLCLDCLPNTAPLLPRLFLFLPSRHHVLKLNDLPVSYLCFSTRM